MDDYFGSCVLLDFFERRYVVKVPMSYDNNFYLILFYGKSFKGFVEISTLYGESIIIVFPESIM